MKNEEFGKKILIVDDSEMNRAILTDMLGPEFTIVEAENGQEAIAILQQDAMINMVLLDIMMPVMNGFETLQKMDELHMLDTMPVIIISAENGSSAISRAFELGAVDYIMRPFDRMIVYRRVVSTLLLYAKQKQMLELMSEQMEEREYYNELMLSIFSHIIEYRNSGSALHVMHVNMITEILLKALNRTCEHYELSSEDINLISMAASLHDIGKILIPPNILEKPAKLTESEFEQVKQHSKLGASLLENLMHCVDDPMIKYAYEICYWHHERYDGKGYPDGLKGDEIPISAQIVAMADVYDALTSERVYSAPYSHEKAVEMIMNNECGNFNPELLVCFEKCAPEISKTLAVRDEKQMESEAISKPVIQSSMLQQEETMPASQRSVQLLEHERTRYENFATMMQEVQFEYEVKTQMLHLSAWGAAYLDLPEFIKNPKQEKKFLHTVGMENVQAILFEVGQTSSVFPIARGEYDFWIKGTKRRFKVICRSQWDVEGEHLSGLIGVAINIQEEHENLKQLEKMAFQDALTGISNLAGAKAHISDCLQHHQNKNFALIIFDVDNFKTFNDTRGHGFGNLVLQNMAERMRDTMRNDDLISRIGGDEFMIFFEYNSEVKVAINRVFHELGHTFEDVTIHISMGVCTTEMAGYDYDSLLTCADKALYAAKRNGKDKFYFYDAVTMNDMFSVLSPIESD